MADLSNAEKRKLESLFGMKTGYVLDFSDRTFAEFVVDSTGHDIFDAKYAYASGSKANRLRAYWSVEPNHIVGQLLGDLIAYGLEQSVTPDDAALVDACSRTAERLSASAGVEDLDAIIPNADGREFDLLARAVRESIERGQPETGLDRLHTFLVKYLRVLCGIHGIPVDRSKPLHSLFGEYVKAVRAAGLIQSEMADRILRATISTLEAFNAVRNEQSFAHPGHVLTYEESLLIFKHVASTICFIRHIEKSGRDVSAEKAEPTDDDSELAL